MARFRRTSVFQDIVLPLIPYFLPGLIMIIIAGFWSFSARDSGEDTSPAPEVLGNVYICGGCGKEYVNQFPYTSPWAGYPTEHTPSGIVDGGRETSYNGSIDGATPADILHHVTGNLSTRDDVDFYSFTVEVPSCVVCAFWFYGSSGGYTYLWNATLYGTDGKSVLLDRAIPCKESGEPSYIITDYIKTESDLEPGTYYMKISAASGGNPFMNGYSDMDYNICFFTICSEHTSLAYALTSAPTCSQGGELTAKCNICGLIVSTEALEPLAHIWSKWKTVEKISLSTPLGECSRTCALCGEVETDALLFHLLNREPKTDPDAVTVMEIWPETGTAACMSEGIVETVCLVCGNVEEERKEAPGHTYGEWVTMRDATCSAEGERSHTCAACGHVEKESLERIPHTYGKAVRVSGSILDAPVVSQKTCTECGYVDTTESGWTRWILPAIIVLGIAAASAILVQVSRMARKLYRSATKKRQKETSKKQQERTFLCPYCFETRPLNSVEFRCTNKLCRDVPDPQMTRYMHSGRDLVGKPTFGDGFIQWDAEGFPRSAGCPKCRKTTYKVICPSCHNPLPESTLTGDDMIISVVGSRDTGKTHFFAVIINELIERVAPAFSGALEGFDDTTDRYSATFKKKLYVDLKRFAKTDSSLVNVDNGAYRPLIYILKLQEKGILGLKEKVRTFTLVFFDSAGEDLESEDIMRTVNRYICKSSGIIFLLDPLKIPAVRAQLDKREVDRASSAEVELYQPDDILVRVSDLIRKDQGLCASDKIKIPVSVVFSKLDVIEPLIPRDCTLLEASPHCREGVFDLSDWHNVNAEVQGLLQTWESGSFLSQLKLNYTDYSCFTVSSLGMHNNPDDNDKISRPCPHRIEDPLLWILMKQKAIKAKR